MGKLGKRLARGVTAIIDGIPGELGRLNADGSYTVKVDGTLNEVYVRLYGDPLQTVTAIDMLSSRKARLPVRVRKNLGRRYKVVGLDELAAEAFLGEAAPSALIPPLITDSINAIWNGAQLKPGRVRPFTGEDLQFIMEELPYLDKLLGGVDTITDATSAVAAIGSGKKAWVVFSVDPATNVLSLTNGADADPTDELTWADAAAIAVPAGEIPLTAYVFQDGDTVPTNRPIGTDQYFTVDLRPWVTLPGGGGGSMDDFTVAGDSGTPETISDGDTLSILGGTGLSSVVSATDTITVNLDTPVALAHGGTHADLSATGGANQFLKQSSSGANVTVGTIADADIPDALTISGGTINNTPIGASTPSTGAFTNLSVTTFEDFTEASTPSTPASDHARLWAADDNGYTVERWIDSTARSSQIFRDNIVTVQNNTGATIAANVVVFIGSGASGAPRIAKANPSAAATCANGITLDSATTGNYQRVLCFGILTGFDTSGAAAGSAYYLSTTAGTLTTTAPVFATLPVYRQIVAYSLDSTASGTLLVCPQAPQSIQIPIQNLKFGLADNGSPTTIEFYSDSSKHVSLRASTLTGGSQNVDIPDLGSATTDTLAVLDKAQTFTNKKFNDGTTINDSAGATGDFTVKGDNDNATLVVDVSADATGFGTATPDASAKLHVVSTSKGAIPAPSMTAAQRAAISSPAAALQTWGNDDYTLSIYDSVRHRAVSSVGYLPYALPFGLTTDSNPVTANNIAAAGGSYAVPVMLNGHMLLESVSVRCGNTSAAHTWGWDLYCDDLDNSNTIRRVAASNADETFTPVAATTRTITVASAPVYLAPGTYWLIFQNRHASNTFNVISWTPPASIFTNWAQTKTTTNPNGATIDMVAATWTKTSLIPTMRLNGRSFGESTAY